MTSWQDAFVAFEDDDIDLLAEMEHERWRRDLLAQGYQAKTGPSLLPWRDLPETAKDLHRHTMKSMPRLLAGLGFQIRRLPRQTGQLGQAEVE